MKKHVVLIVGLLLVMAMAWAAFGQAEGGGRGGFGRTRESQQKAIAALQEHVAKLKAMMEQQPGFGAQGRSFQDMSEDERNKMMEQFRQRREEQAAVMAAIQQQVDVLKGGRQLMTEHEQAMAPLNELLASAKAEKATATAAKIQKLIDERQSQFEAKITSMGMTMEQLQRMGQRRGPQ